MKKLSSGQIKANGNGIGLWNIQQRIHILYSEKYGLEFQREGDRTQVWIKVPYKFEMGEEENV